MAGREGSSQLTEIESDVEQLETPEASAEPGNPPATLDVLLDVELPLSVSFGRTYMPVRDILKLSTGSIVELNCPANSLVDVIVNNCTIARGEVVVVDGNYGVRIDQVISRRERMMIQHQNSAAVNRPTRIIE
jgi:flagellar motor switch protein FliN/FliY